MASTDARPIPIKNTAFRAVFPILDADGDLVTGATGLDSEVSKDQGTFADCTNEATEIATSSGMYYLDLTSTEMNADCVAIIVKTSSSGAKTTVLVFYPEETGDINVDVTAWLGTAAATPTVAGVPEVDITHAGGTAITVASGIPEVKVASIANNAITAASIATGAIDADAIADNAIDAGAIAADAITAAKVAADVTTEIQSGLATAAELAKVPKSDGTATWNATALASLQSEATDALNAYDPPTRAEATSDANSILAAVDAVDNFVDTEIGALVTAVDALPTNAELATALGTADDAVLAAIAALNNLSASAAATAVLTTAITESYAADGAAPTLAQFISLVTAMLTEFAISGTTLTAKKLDGSTTAATFTLDSATSPTSITRAT